VNPTSERNALEQARMLAQAEERYELLFRSAVHGILVVNRAGRALAMNRVAEEILGRTCADFGSSAVQSGQSPAIREDGTPLPGIDYPAQVTFSTGREVHSIVMGVYNPRDRAWRWIKANAAPLAGAGDAGSTDVCMMFVDITEHRHAELQIKHLNEQLEAKARALEALNRELETFSYSVSHDLRAPLRSMDGFSRVLLEDYAGKLDANGQDCLNRICAACHRMNSLVDALIGLSRITREEMHVAPLDLSALVETVAEGLRHAAAGRKIEFAITPHLTVTADPRLLHIALEQLLGNAVKFTRERSVARIEFGVTEQGGERVFFVRDNGVGFNSAFAHRLFGAFQHFHSLADYPGSGIGLATVQRIIHRHGGRVFAESQPDEGATFFFSLPASTNAL